MSRNSTVVFAYQVSFDLARLLSSSVAFQRSGVACCSAKVRQRVLCTASAVVMSCSGLIIGQKSGSEVQRMRGSCCICLEAFVSC